MRVLITGGAGFQGGYLAERLVRSGHEVTVLSTLSSAAKRNIAACADDIVVVWGSVTDVEIVDKTVRDQDAVVHMAARVNVDDSIDSPVTFLTVNVLGTYNLLEAVRKAGTRLILASTCEVYGSSSPSPLTERADLRPHSPYAASKAGADRLCFAYHKTYGTNVTIVRPCNIFGERQKSGSGGAVIPIFASLAAQGKPLTVFGTGEQRREYMHVSDVVAAYELVLGRDDLEGEVVNVGTGETASIKEIAEFISARTGVGIQYRPARPGEVPGFDLDSSAARRLGFAPKVGFWDGLGRYMDWVSGSISGT